MGLKLSGVNVDIKLLDIVPADLNFLQRQSWAQI